MTTPTIARKYRIPSIEPEVHTVQLDDFDIDDIREYLDRYARGTLNGPAGASVSSQCLSTQALLIEPDQLGRIETLALCGQLDHARTYALEIISDHIGRTL